MWSYEVSGKQVLLQWFSYRKRDRERPIIGARRPPSPLGHIQPERWLAEYTSELINVLNVLGWLVALEPAQAALLEKVCTGPTISAEDLRAAGVFAPLAGSGTDRRIAHRAGSFHSPLERWPKDLSASEVARWNSVGNEESKPRK